MIETVFREAHDLAELAAEPSRAARLRLYARIASWVLEHPDDRAHNENCVVCGGGLTGRTDTVTGRAVSVHLQESQKDAALLSQTLRHWVSASLGMVSRDLPKALQDELDRDLPAHPRDLIKMAVTTELFGTPPFKGVLADLRLPTAGACETSWDQWPQLAGIELSVLPPAISQQAHLQRVLDRTVRAIHFARWRRTHSEEVVLFTQSVVGLGLSGAEPPAASLIGRQKTLSEIVKAADPINAALKDSERLVSDLAKRRTAERRIAQYGIAVPA